MDRMNLREAAERTYRSVTTLRRYIRSGRLRAEKRDGRYGPEYFVLESDLEDAGLFVEEVEPDDVDRDDLGPVDGAPPRASLERRAAPAARRAGAPDAVPLGLYQELQWKHEQLLVQYGMMRAGGLRAVELREQVAERERDIERLEDETRRLRAEIAGTTERLEADLRKARFELEGRNLEVAALQEKVRALEMLTRNQVTSESIEEQYRALFRQVRRVGKKATEAAAVPGRAPRPWLVRDVPRDGDH